MTDKTDMTDEIIRLEWDMFQAVNDGGPRADCQDDMDTFDAMRRAQFEAWPDGVRRSYLGDLTAANLAGRNLVNEKYIHMMKTTAPAAYEALAASIAPPAGAAQALAKSISDKMLDQTAALQAEYPYVSGAGRPLYSSEDWQGDVSIETYQLGELLTYSERTLALLLEYVEQRERAGGSLARDIMENTVRYYGYDTLEAAEAAAKERSDNEPIEFTFGCDCGCDCGE